MFVLARGCSVALALAVLLCSAACNLVFGLDPLTYEPAQRIVALADAARTDAADPPDSAEPADAADATRADTSSDLGDADAHEDAPDAAAEEDGDGG